MKASAWESTMLEDETSDVDSNAGEDIRASDNEIGNEATGDSNEDGDRGIDDIPEGPAAYEDDDASNSSLEELAAELGIAIDECSFFSRFLQ